MLLASPHHGEAPGRPRPGFPLWSLGLALLLVGPLLAPFAWTGVYPALRPVNALSSVVPQERALTAVTLPGALAWGLALVWFALAYWRSRDVRPWEAGLVLVGGTLALLRTGNAWLYALALIAPMARQLSLARLSPAVRAAAAGVLVLGTAGSLLVARPASAPASALKAVAATRASTAEVIFAWQPWASSVRQAAPAGATVLGAGSPYAWPSSFWTSYGRVMSGRVGWSSLLDQEHVGLVVLDTQGLQGDLARLVEASPGWHVVETGDGALVAERVGS